MSWRCSQVNRHTRRVAGRSSASWRSSQARGGVASGCPRRGCGRRAGRVAPRRRARPSGSGLTSPTQVPVIGRRATPTQRLASSIRQPTDRGTPWPGAAVLTRASRWSAAAASAAPTSSMSSSRATHLPIHAVAADRSSARGHAGRPPCARCCDRAPRLRARPRARRHCRPSAAARHTAAPTATTANTAVATAAPAPIRDARATRTMPVPLVVMTAVQRRHARPRRADVSSLST